MSGTLKMNSLGTQNVRDSDVEHSIAFLGYRVCVAMTKMGLEQWNEGKKGYEGASGRLWV
jgi:hypothetical protein